MAHHNPPMCTRNGSRGITLIELCFGLAMVALLAGLAAPGFRATLRTGAVRAATYDLLAGLQQTRANSILEARTGVLCPSDAAGSCRPSATPASAWVAFLEVGGRQQLIAEHPLPPGVVLRSSRSPLRFWPHALAASTGTLTICDSLGVAAPRAIVISQSGRARLDTPAPGGCG
jgi:Tfp pilus assembly protein FimT